MSSANQPCPRGCALIGVRQLIDSRWLFGRGFLRFRLFFLEFSSRQTFFGKAVPPISNGESYQSQTGDEETVHHERPLEGRHHRIALGSAPVPGYIRKCTDAKRLEHGDGVSQVGLAAGNTGQGEVGDEKNENTHIAQHHRAENAGHREKYRRGNENIWHRKDRENREVMA